MKGKDHARAERLEARLRAGERLSGSEWRQYRKLVTRMRRDAGAKPPGHRVTGYQEQRLDGTPLLATYDREGHLMPVAAGRRARR